MKYVIDLAPGKQAVVALEDDKLITGTVQDCSPHLEYLAALRNAGITGSAEVKFAGLIPDVVVEAYCNDNGVSFAEFIGNGVHVKRLLNDPAYKNLRVWEGRL